jgi:hypothetical protein
VDDGLEWAGGPNATWAGAERKQRKKSGWAARMTGPNQGWAAEISFSNFESRI